MEGKTEWEGRLEICLGQRWGNVGNDGWTKVNSEVVCTELGYDFTGMLAQFTLNIFKYLFLPSKSNLLLVFHR